MEFSDLYIADVTESKFYFQMAIGWGLKAFEIRIVMLLLASSRMPLGMDARERNAMSRSSFKISR